MDLVSRLNETSNLNRLSAVDAAYVGSPYQGSNFKAKWQGYDADGNATVKYNGQVYTARNLSSRSSVLNKSVILRVSKGSRFVNY
jgi:hypothetical protein